MPASPCHVELGWTSHPHGSCSIPEVRSQQVQYMRSAHTHILYLLVHMHIYCTRSIPEAVRSRFALLWVSVENQA